jgi:restriction endonuclease S subunit
MPEHSETTVFSGFIIKCTPRTNMVLPKFLFYLLRTPKLRARIVELSSTAAITNISQDRLKSVEVPRPPLEQQRRILAELDTEAAQMEAARSLIDSFSTKMQRTIDRLWSASKETELNAAA